MRVRRSRRSEVWARWCGEIAPELGLPVGDERDLRIGDADDPQWRLYVADECEAALDRLIALSRRPRWRLDRQAGRIVEDPHGTTRLADLVGDLVDELARRADADRRRQAVDELRAGELTVERVAARWGVSRTTLWRWARSATLHGDPADATSEAENVPDDGASRAGSFPGGRRGIAEGRIRCSASRQSF